jgi:hypothetical protein
MLGSASGSPLALRKKHVDTFSPRLSASVSRLLRDCPTFNGVMANLLQGLWGSLTPENSISDLLPRMETGSLHAYVADLVNEQWYVTFSANDNSTSPNRLAYSRQWAQLDLKSIFAVELGQQEAKEEQSQIMLE